MSSSDADGWYVTGLTDGEGCFRAAMMKTPGGHLTCRTEYLMCLRADDVAVLEWLKDYFKCGNVATHAKKNANPMSTFSVGSLRNNIDIVIPHFDKYPLKAKKSRDFLLWKDITLQLVDFYRRPLSDANVAHFQQLCSELTEGRKYPHKELNNGNSSTRC